MPKISIPRHPAYREPGVYFFGPLNTRYHKDICEICETEGKLDKFEDSDRKVHWICVSCQRVARKYSRFSFGISNSNLEKVKQIRRKQISTSP